MTAGARGPGAVKFHAAGADPFELDYTSGGARSPRTRSLRRAGSLTHH